jgi:hypothetical protein
MRSMIALIVIGVMFGAVGMEGYREFIDTRPSLIVQQDVQEGGTVIQGGILRVHIKQARKVDCDTRITRILWQWDVLFPTEKYKIQVGGEGVVEPDSGNLGFTVGIPIPLELPPGDYNYQSYFYVNCAGFFHNRTEVVTTKPIPVKVVSNPALKNVSSGGFIFPQK